MPNCQAQKNKLNNAKDSELYHWSEPKKTLPLVRVVTMNFSWYSLRCLVQISSFSSSFVMGHQMSPLNITQPLGIWSIMATIRWCSIFTKWDSYQPLFVYLFCLSWRLKDQRENEELSLNGDTLDLLMAPGATLGDWYVMTYKWDGNGWDSIYIYVYIVSIIKYIYIYTRIISVI